MRDRVRQALTDLLDHAAAVERLVSRGKDAYDRDEMLRYAGEDHLIRLGETARRVDHADADFVPSHPELELRHLKDARNVVAYGDDVVDPELVWEILAVHVPNVAGRVRELFRA